VFEKERDGQKKRERGREERGPRCLCLYKCVRACGYVYANIFIYLSNASAVGIVAYFPGGDLQIPTHLFSHAS